MHGPKRLLKGASACLHNLPLQACPSSAVLFPPFLCIPRLAGGWDLQLGLQPCCLTELQSAFQSVTEGRWEGGMPM